MAELSDADVGLEEKPKELSDADVGLGESIGPSDLSAWQKFRTGTVGRKLFGPTDIEREGMAGGVSGSQVGLSEIPQAMLKMTSLGLPPVRKAVETVTDPLIEALPAAPRGIAKGVREFALDVPLAPIPGVTGPKTAIAALSAFGGQYLSELPDAYKQFQQAVSKGDVEGASKIAAEAGLGGALLAFGAAHGISKLKKPVEKGISDATQTRIEQESRQPEHIEAVPRGLPAEAGGGNRPVGTAPQPEAPVPARPGTPPDKGVNAVAKPSVPTAIPEALSREANAEIIRGNLPESYLGKPVIEVARTTVTKGTGESTTYHQFVTVRENGKQVWRGRPYEYDEAIGKLYPNGLLSAGKHGKNSLFVHSEQPTVESVTPLEPQSGAQLPVKEVAQPQVEQLHAGVEIPGIKTFVEKDVKPIIQRGTDAVKAAKDIILKLVAPVTRAEPKDVDVLFESKGYKDELLFKANAALEGARKQMGALPVEEQVAFIDRVKRGQPQPTPELQQTADLLRTWDDKLFSEVKKYRPELPYLENHLRVLWKTIPVWQKSGQTEVLPKEGTSKSAIMGRRPWQGSKGFLKKHVLEDISEGLKQGGVPVSFNPVELFSLHAQDAMKFVAANRAWEGLKKTGAVEFVRRGEAPPEGFTRINDSIARVYFKTDKGLVSPGEWWVEPNAARLINNYLSRDYIRSNALGRGLMDLKNATTAIELGLSPFHAVFETNETIGSSLGLGLAKMFSGKFSEGAKDIRGG